MHKRIKTAALLSAALTASALPITAAAEEEWQTAYRQLLTEYRTTDGFMPETTGEISFGSRWDLCDINGDGIPELFISPDTSHAFGCKVYSFVDGEVVALETREGQTFGEYGLTKVCPELHLVRAYHFGMGTEMVGYYEFDGAVLTEVDRFVGTSVYISEELGTQDTYQRNGEDIYEKEYIDGIAEYEAHTWVESVGRAYSFDDMSPLKDGALTVPPVAEELDAVPDKPINWGMAAFWGILSAGILAVLAVFASRTMRS